MATVSFKKFEVEDDDGSIVLKHYDDIGSGGPQIAASYEIALDKEFTQIIDATYFNKEYLEAWSSPLPRIGAPDGTFYTNLDKLYARGKIYAGRLPPGFRVPTDATDEEVDELCRESKTIFFTPWTDISVGTQTYQEVKITTEGAPDIDTNSDVIHMHFNAVKR